MGVESIPQTSLLEKKAVPHFHLRQLRGCYELKHIDATDMPLSNVVFAGIMKFFQGNSHFSTQKCSVQ